MFSSFVGVLDQLPHWTAFPFHAWRPYNTHIWYPRLGNVNVGTLAVLYCCCWSGWRRTTCWPFESRVLFSNSISFPRCSSESTPRCLNTTSSSSQFPCYDWVCRSCCSGPQAEHEAVRKSLADGAFNPDEPAHSWCNVRKRMDNGRGMGQSAVL